MDILSVNGRRALILEQLLKSPVSVAEMARLTNVSEITIRRDFDEMEKLGYLKRTHGGAVSVGGRTTIVPFAIRQCNHQDEKSAMAQYAATLIQDGDSIALDTGTTILAMADHLHRFNNLTVLTNSFHAASRLIYQPQIRVVLPEGVLDGQEGAVVGETVVKSLQDYYIDKCFFSVGAIDGAAGLTEHGFQDAQIKRIMISRAREAILLVDSSKFGKVAFKQVSPLTSIAKMITDQRPPGDLLDAAQRASVEVHIVSPDGQCSEVL